MTAEPEKLKDSTISIACLVLLCYIHRPCLYDVRAVVAVVCYVSSSSQLSSRLPKLLRGDVFGFIVTNLRLLRVCVFAQL